VNILLVRPKPHKKTINLQSFMICEPLELQYCAALLKQEGHNVTIVDFLLEKKPLEHFLRQESYDLVGLTGYICHVGIIKEWAKRIKNYNKNIITVVGGVHAEVVEQDFKSEYIDFILSKNGLDGIAQIADGLEYDPTKCEMVKKFDYPYPDREITKKYRDNYNYIFHEKCATLKTSFGCSYSCEFCFCAKVSPYFTREIDDVIAEIKTIEEKNIFIVDDNFLFNKPRLEEFCTKLEQEGIQKNFIAFGRADFICENEELLHRLKKIGFEAIFVGLESFKNSELADLNKKLSVEQNIKAINMLEKCGLRCYAGIIVGHDWDKHDFNNLISHLNSFSNIFINVQPLTPMPGTASFEKLKDLIAVPRERYELWDMAHLLIKPTKMGARRFYYHLLRVYLKVLTNRKRRKQLKEEFGKTIYKRVRRGAIKIFFQYLRLIIFGRA